MEEADPSKKQSKIEKISTFKIKLSDALTKMLNAFAQKDPLKSDYFSQEDLNFADSQPNKNQKYIDSLYKLREVIRLNPIRLLIESQSMKDLYLTQEEFSYVKRNSLGHFADKIADENLKNKIFLLNRFTNFVMGHSVGEDPLLSGEDITIDKIDGDFMKSVFKMLFNSEKISFNELTEYFKNFSAELSNTKGVPPEVPREIDKFLEFLILMNKQIILKEKFKKEGNQEKVEQKNKLISFIRTRYTDLQRDTKRDKFYITKKIEKP